MTDRRIIGIQLSASEVRSDYTGRAGREATLFVRCNHGSSTVADNGLEVYISWGDELIPESQAANTSYEPTVDLRFDESVVQRAIWGLSTSRNATFAPRDYSAIVGLKSANRMAAKVWRYDQSTITAQWQVDGFGDAMKPIEQKCGTGAWQHVSYPADALTGSKRIRVDLMSFDHVGGTDEEPWIGARCTYGSTVASDNRLELFFHWNDQLGSGYQPKVSTRIDDGEIQEDIWSLSTDSTATFVPSADVLTILEELKTASRLVARVEKKDGTAVTGQWYITGLREAVEPIEEKCAVSSTSP